MNEKDRARTLYAPPGPGRALTKVAINVAGSQLLGRRESVCRDNCVMPLGRFARACVSEVLLRLQSPGVIGGEVGESA